MKEIIEVLALDHGVITAKIDEIETLQNNDSKESFNKMAEILAFFDDFTFKTHHQKEEKILYEWMLKQNAKSDTALIQKIVDDHESFERNSKKIQGAIQKYLNDATGVTPVSIHYEVSLFISKYREHMEREESFIFQIAESLKITPQELERLKKEFKLK